MEQRVNDAVERLRKKLRDALVDFARPQSDLSSRIIRIMRHLHDMGPARYPIPSWGSWFGWHRGFSPSARARFAEDARKRERRAVQRAISWALNHASGLARGADEDLEQRVAAQVSEPLDKRPRRPWPRGGGASK